MNPKSELKSVEPFPSFYKFGFLFGEYSPNLLVQTLFYRSLPTSLLVQGHERILMMYCGIDPPLVSCQKMQEVDPGAQS